MGTNVEQKGGPEVNTKSARKVTLGSLRIQQPDMWQWLRKCYTLLDIYDHIDTDENRTKFVLKTLAKGSDSNGITFDTPHMWQYMYIYVNKNRSRNMKLISEQICLLASIDSDIINCLSWMAWNESRYKVVGTAESSAYGPLQIIKSTWEGIARNIKRLGDPAISSTSAIGAERKSEYVRAVLYLFAEGFEYQRKKLVSSKFPGVDDIGCAPTVYNFWWGGYGYSTDIYMPTVLESRLLEQVPKYSNWNHYKAVRVNLKTANANRTVIIGNVSYQFHDFLPCSWEQIYKVWFSI